MNGRARPVKIASRFAGVASSGCRVPYCRSFAIPMVIPMPAIAATWIALPTMKKASSCEPRTAEVREEEDLEERAPSIVVT